MQAGYAYTRGGGARAWSGILAHAEAVEALQDSSGKEGLSTYTLQIVPSLWLLNNRRGNRIYQHLLILDIIDKLLAKWKSARNGPPSRQYPSLETSPIFPKKGKFWNPGQGGGIPFPFRERTGVAVF